MCWLKNLLQGLTEDHIVEAAGGIIIDLFTQVTLQYAQSPGNTVSGFFLILLYPCTLYLLVFFKPGEKITITASQVQHLTLGFYCRTDDLQVKTDFFYIRRYH